MATVEGLNLRGGRFYLRVLIPQDLQEAYSGKTRVNLSLRTCDRATAVLNGLRAKVQWLEEFTSLRNGQLGAQNDSPTAETLLAQGNGIHIPVEKATDSSTTGFNETPMPCLPESATARHTGVQGNLHGHPIPARIRPSCNAQLQRGRTATQAQGMTLWEVYELWKNAERRAKENEQSYARSLTLAEKCLGGPMHIKSITRAHGNAFKAWLQAPEQAYAPKTSKNHFTNLQSLLRFACLELEAIAQNPWQGLCIKVPKTVTRRPWRDEELRTLFCQPLFQRLELPSNSGPCGGLAGYWIPLIGLYTGARISELAQLRTHDIDQEDGIAVIRITDTADGQKLKTSASRRNLPIHPELIRLGLLDYVQDILARGFPSPHLTDSLWPDLGTCAERQGNQISSWFSSFRKKAGLTDTYPDFHCLRHTVRTKLAQARVPEQLMDAITGHETGGSTGRKVYQHIQVEDIATAIQSLLYDSIELPRVYGVHKPKSAETEAAQPPPRYAPETADHTEPYPAIEWSVATALDRPCGT